MATAKKGKKKGITLALQDFLQETPGVVSSMPIRKSSMNWADEVEDNHDVYDSRSSKASVILPTAPKASRDFDDIIDKVPLDPPYMAYISNLPYDVDEDEIAAFFKNMKIKSLRIPKDDRAGENPRLKGFGYVDFEDRESLLNALVIPDTTIKNRRIRIEVATDYDDKRRGGRSDMSRDRTPRSDVSSGDWRSGPRTEGSSDSNERRGYNRDNRDRDRDRDESSSSSGAWRSNREPEQRGGGGFSRPSERSFNRDDNRDSDFSRARGGDRDSDFSRNRGGDRDSDFSRARGGDRDSDFSRARGGDRDRDRDDRGFMSRRFDSDRGGRSTGFSRNPPPRDDTESSRSGEQRQRPKLVLAPRSKTSDPETEVKSSSASIFGNAKPVDTSARERQIEERLARDHTEPPPRREASQERKEQVPDKDEEEDVVLKDQKDKEEDSEPETKIIETGSTQPKSDANGLVEKSQHSKRNGDHEKKDHSKAESGEKHKADSGEKHKADNRKRDEKRDRPEKEMPKLKPTEAPNFIANNKFAFLETEDASD